MTTRPVVVHAIDSLATGGLENGVVNLVNNAGPEFRHVIVCITKTGSLRERVRSDVDVFSLGKQRGQDPVAMVRFVRLLWRIGPTVVHSRNWAALDAVLAARLARVRVVVHGEHGREAADPGGRDARRNRIRRLLHPLVSQFVAVSHDLQRWLLEVVGLPVHKVAMIPNGVDLARFGHGNRREARDALRLPTDALVVGTIGRLDPVKAQAALIRAFVTLRAAHPEAWLVIAGDGPCRNDLLNAAESLGVARRTRLLGERSDVPLLLAALDLFVLPSIAEGMSNTVLEAMASGLPIVATRVGGNPELIEDGTNGRLIARQDDAGLAGAMAAYLDDPHLRALHGKASRQRAVDHFGLDRMTEAYMHLYDRLLGRRGTEDL